MAQGGALVTLRHCLSPMQRAAHPRALREIPHQQGSLELDDAYVLLAVWTSILVQYISSPKYNTKIDFLTVAPNIVHSQCSFVFISREQQSGVFSP